MTYSYKHFCSLLVCLFLACSTFGETIFVKANATGDNDGASWVDAYTTLSAALNEAEEDDQIWVAAGTYYPTVGANRSISFVIPNGVEILGGFPNTGNPTLTDRDPSTHLTTLSGDIDQDGTLANNSYTIIYTIDVDASTVVDGFSIVFGNADGGVPQDFPVNRQNGGAGWYNESSNGTNSNPVIKNCIFSDHHASNRGAAMFHKPGLNANANYTIESSTFFNNAAARAGGAIFNSKSGNNSICAPTISNTTFQENMAGQSGGAVYNNGDFFGEVSGTYTNCVFNNNRAIGNEGGAVYNNATFSGTSSPTFTNCDFFNNDASPGSGGAIYTDASGNGVSNYRLTNCIFDGNTSDVNGGAICNIISNTGNITPIYGNCVFKENSSINGGATYSRAAFGGTIDVLIVNCIFYKNQGGIGGTVYQNETGATSQSSTKISNSIFEQNTAGFSPIFHLTGPSTITVNNNLFDVNGCLELVQGEGTREATCTGGNLFNQDPLFANAAAGDFHVAANSPAVDAGSNADVPSYLITDADGNPRIATGIVDLGIYEQVNNSSDTDGDGILDGMDNCPLVANVNQENADGDSAGAACDCDDSPATGVSCTTSCSTFYLDSDGDGFGNPAMSVITCVAPPNYVADNTDFDDMDATLYPNAPELCDGKDNNNNGQIDEGTDDDNDGVCNEDDVCPGGDDTIDLNNNGTPDACESQINLTCPADITVSAVAGQTTAVVNWTEPTADTDCNGGGTGGTVCSPETIPGFTYKGNFNGKNYFFAEQSDIWSVAKNVAISNGANLVVINSQEENDFVKSIIGNNIIHIGLTDAATEGTYEWVNGETVTFTNFPGTPEGEDFGLLYFWDGSWHMSGNYSKFYVIEKACGGGSNSGLTVEQTDGLANGAAFPVGTTTVTYRADDDCNDPVFCSFTVTVEATNSDLTINCPADITVNAAPGATDAIVNWDAPSITSNCPTGTPTATPSQANGTAFPVGMTTVTYTAIDDCGGTATCSFIVTVEATNTDLSIICPADITVSAAPGATDAVVNWNDPSITSNCPTGTPTATPSQVSGTPFPIGTTTVTYTATDDCGGTATCSFIVTVEATNTDLSIICPADITVSAAPGATDAVVNWNDPSITSNCPTGTPTATPSQASGTPFPIGTTTVTYSATDDCGGTATCSFNVTVNEGTSNLTIVCPNNIEVTANPGETSKVITWANPSTTTDCTTGSVTVTASKDSGTAFDIGTTTVTLTATDGCGTTTTCTFTVTVNEGTSILNLTCPADIVMDAASGATSKVINYSDPIGSTTCATNGINLTLVSGLASGEAFPIGTTVIEYQGEDDCGSTVVCSFSVTINATGSNLNINCPADITASVNTSGGTTAVTWDDPTGSSSCATNGYIISQTAGPAKGSQFGVGTTTITYTATDDCGNSETCSFTITVNLDNSSLNLDCPANISVTTPEGSGGKVVTWATPTATTDCTIGGGSGNTCSGDPKAGYTYLGTFEGSDYYISDGKSPWLTAKANAETAGGTLAGIESQAENDFILSIVNGEIVQIGLTDMDDEGNPVWLNGESTDFQNFSGFTANNEENDYGVFYHWDGTWDWSSNGSWKLSLLEIKCNGPSNSIPAITQMAGPASGSIFPVGTTTVTYQATDDCSNVTTCSFTVTVTETQVVCDTDTDGGRISGNEIICDPYDPQTITSTSLPTGGSGSIEYVWLKSESGCPDNISQAIPNSNSATYNPPFITATTNYVRWSRRENCTEWVVSNCITKTVDECGGSTNYCSLSADQPWQEWISKVSLADLDNESGKSLGYDDYTPLAANVTTGQDYTVSVTLSFSYNQWNEMVFVWIDYNQDNDFNDPGELVLEQLSLSNGNGGPQPDAITQLISIPTTAAIGNTRMRVAMKREEDSNSNPCGSFVHGEVEDYTVSISAGASSRAKPVLAFEAYPVTGNSVLEWFSNTTDLEYNFEVERSTDNQQFEKIENILVQFEDDFNSNYKIVDEQPEFGENYYRIKQVFTDGAINYTTTKKLVYGGQHTRLHFYPNPASERLFVNAKALAGFKGKIMIINMLGQIKRAISFEKIPSDALEIPLDNLDNGMYSLLIQVNGKPIQTELFVVEKMR